MQTNSYSKNEFANIHNHINTEIKSEIIKHINFNKAGAVIAIYANSNNVKYANNSNRPKSSRVITNR